PYRLVEDIRGVGFQTADKIARHVGIEEDSPERLRAGLLHVLENCHDGGDLYYPRSLLEEKARELLGKGVVSDRLGFLKDVCEKLRLNEKIVIEKKSFEGLNNPNHKNRAEDKIYLSQAYRAETMSVEHIKRLISSKQHE